METQFSATRSIFLSIIFAVSWFTLVNKLSIGKVLWFLRHCCDCREVPKIAVTLELSLFLNSCHSKTTGLSCSIKISIRIFENMTRISSEKVRRIFWSLHLYPLIWKLPRMQSFFKQFIFQNIRSRSRKLQA